MFLSLFRRAQKLATKPSAKGRPARRHTIQLGLETLEDRMLLSSSAVLNSGTLNISADANTSLTVVVDKSNPALVDVQQFGVNVNKAPIPIASVQSVVGVFAGNDALTIASSRGQPLQAGTATLFYGGTNNLLEFQGGSYGSETLSPSYSGQLGSAALGGVNYQFDQGFTSILDSTAVANFTVNEPASATVQNGLNSGGLVYTDIQGTGSNIQFAGKNFVHLELNKQTPAEVDFNNTVSDAALQNFSVDMNAADDVVNINNSPAGVVDYSYAHAANDNTFVNASLANVKDTVSVTGGFLTVADYTGTSETITESSITGPGHAAINFSSLQGLTVDGNTQQAETFTIKPSSSTASFNNLPITISTEYVKAAPTFDVTIDEATKLNLTIFNNFSRPAAVHVHNPDGLGTASGSLSANRDTGKVTVNFPAGSTDNSVINYNDPADPGVVFTFDHNAS